MNIGDTVYYKGEEGFIIERDEWQDKPLLVAFGDYDEGKDLYIGGTRWFDEEELTKKKRKKRKSKKEEKILNFSQDEISQLKEIAKFCKKHQDGETNACDIGELMQEIEKDVNKFSESFLMKLLSL